MKVLLRKNWVAPNGIFYEKSASGTEIDDAFAELLPSTAKILADVGMTMAEKKAAADEKAAKAPIKPVALSELKSKKNKKAESLGL